MKIKILILTVLLGMTHAHFCYANQDEGLAPAEGFFLPEGDAAAGQAAFARLKCAACHWVQNEIGFEAPVAEKTGPILGVQQADYAAGWLASSIVSPSHTIAINSKGESEGSELSRMGDFRDTMTVRELIDLVAYIRSLPQQSEPLAKNAEVL